MAIADTIRITNCDAKSRMMGGVEKRKNGEMLSSTARAIIYGQYYGKTNILISLFESPNSIRFKNMYVYSKWLQQSKYQYLLENLFTFIDEIGTIRSPTTVMSNPGASKFYSYLR